MAEAPANSSHGGYEDDFVDAVQEDFKCTICKFPLRDPILTKCGHRFCSKCLDIYFKTSEREGRPLHCPVDREALSRDATDVFPDKFTERNILSFAIKCPSKGCQWTGELRSKPNHLEACPLKLMKCTNRLCNQIMVRRDLQEHLNDKCPRRNVQCSYCHEAHQACREDAHQLRCRRYPVKCPQLCNGGTFPREEIEDHIKKDCPLTMISCPYAEMGCTTKIQRKEELSHLDSSMGRHLHLVCSKLTETQTQLKCTSERWNETTTKLHNTEKGLKETQTQLKCTSERWNETTTKLHNTEKGLKETQTQLKCISKKWSETTRKLDETERKLSETTRHFENIVEVLESKISQLFTNVSKISNFDRERGRLDPESEIMKSSSPLRERTPPLSRETRSLRERRPGTPYPLKFPEI